jgi:DNA repair exonuclease SbcCD ATPase subunit
MLPFFAPLSKILLDPFLTWVAVSVAAVIGGVLGFLLRRLVGAEVDKAGRAIANAAAAIAKWFHERALRAILVLAEATRAAVRALTMALNRVVKVIIPDLQRAINWLFNVSIPSLSNAINALARRLQEAIERLERLIRTLISEVRQAINWITHVALPGLRAAIDALRALLLRRLADLEALLRRLVAELWQVVAHILQTLIPALWGALARLRAELLTLLQSERAERTSADNQIQTLFDLRLQPLERTVPDLKTRVDRCQRIHDELSEAYDLPDVDPATLALLAPLLPAIAYVVEEAIRYIPQFAGLYKDLAARTEEVLRRRA